MSYTIPEQEFDGSQIPEITFYDNPVTWGETADYTFPFYVYSSSGEPIIDENAYIAFYNTSPDQTSVHKFLIASIEPLVQAKSGTKNKSTGVEVLNRIFNFGGRYKSFTYNDLTVYYVDDPFWTTQPTALVDVFTNQSESLINPRVAWLMVYGGYLGAQITYNLTNCTGSSDNPTTINPGDEEEVVFTADPGFSFQDQAGEYSVTGGYIVGTVLVTETILSFTVALSEGSTAMTISVNPTQDQNVEYRLVNCVKTFGPTNVEPDDYFDILLTAATGYQFNSTADVIATNASLYEYIGSAFPSSTFYARYKANASFTKIIIAANLGGDPYELFGEDELPGDSISPPGTPTTTAVSSGIIGLFKPSVAEMQQLADFMWTDFGGTATTVEEVLEEIFQAFKRSISNPLNYILGLNIIPSQGLSVGSTKYVRFGYVNSQVAMATLSSQFFTVDCGSLSFDTVCGNTFLDYAPYAKFSIYLPYIGFREVDANDFVGHTIGVTYKGDCVSGAVVAFITKDGSVMYQYSGNCACTIPLTADSWGETISAVMSSASNIVTKAAIGAAGGGLQGAALGGGIGLIQSASGVAANPSVLNPAVARSGAVTGAAGLLGVQYPFIIREAVRFHSTEGFNTVEGYPSWYFRQLGDVVGLTKVVNVHLHNIPALADEIAEIENLLKGGVIF